MSKVFIKWTRPLQKIEQVKAHAQYVGFRSQEKEEKGFFSRDLNHADYKKFINRIEVDPALQHWNSIKAQKLIFSLREKDYNAYKRSGKDYKDLVRTTLQKYEEKHGVKLDWIANIHAAEGHPHCHVIIKGVSDNKDKNGRSKRIYFRKEDIDNMKETFDKEFEKDVQYKWHETIDFEKEFNDLSKSFEAVTKTIEKEAEKEQQKAEYERSIVSSKDRADKEKGRER